MIEFAVGVDVTPEFKWMVVEVAEVCFVPNWVGHHKGGPEYRFLTIREPLRQRELSSLESLNSRSRR